MQRKTAYAIVLIFVLAVAASVSYAIYANSSPIAKLDVPASVVSSTFPGYNVSMLTTKYDAFSGLLESEGYISLSDQVFTAKINLTKPMIIDFMLQKDSNSSVSNSTIIGELSLVNESTSNSGSHFALLKIKNYSEFGSSVPIYELLDIGLLNLSTVNRSVNSGLPLMPYYQFTSMFAYKNYYGSVTVDAYSNSSLAANASIHLAEYIFNYTVQKFSRD